MSGADGFRESPRESALENALESSGASDHPPGRPSRLWRREAPTEEITIRDMLARSQFRHVRVPTEHAGDRTVIAALDLAARVGELMLRCGAGAPQVEGAVAAVAAAAGLNHFEADLTMQSLFVQSTAADGTPVTILRVVRSVQRDFARLVSIHELVDGLVEGRLTLAQAASELKRIKARARLFPTWAVNVANALLAAAIAVMLGATPLATLLTVLVVLVVVVVGNRLSGWRVPEFYVAAIGAVIATVLAWLWFTVSPLAPVDRVNDFAFMVSAGIVVLLPSRSLASSVEDVLSGYPVTGAGRLLSVVLVFVGLVIGIAIGLGVVLRAATFSGTGAVSADVLLLRAEQAPWFAALLGALVVGFTGALTLQGRRGLLLHSALLCLLGAGVFALLTRSFDVGPITATGVGGVAVGFGSRIVAARVGAPSMVLAVPASFGLLPGLTVFRGLFEMVGNSSAAAQFALLGGMTTLLGALATLLGIATGSVFGELLAAPLDRRVRTDAARRLR